MKKIILILLSIATLSIGANAQSLSDIFGKLSGSSSSSEESSSSSGLTDALGSLVGSLTSTNKFAVESLVGDWAYSYPAVGFGSDNALKKIGGAAASAALEQKLEPYYQKAGLTSVTLTVEQDLTFKMGIKKLSLSGTISKDEDNFLVFTFSALGKINLGSIKAMATKSGNTLTIVFDATKLMKLLDTISSVANISALSTLNSLLQSYDNLYIGFKMKAQ